MHNIDNASPATVSRNGMVFMSSSIMNWDPIIHGWLLAELPAQFHDTVFSTFESVWVDAYIFITTKLVPKMLLLECMYVRQALDILKGLIPSGDDIKDLKHDMLKKHIVFAIMWSIGALLELDGRKKLQEFLVGHSSQLPLPATAPDETIFEFVVDAAGNWEHWDARVPEYNYPTDSVPDFLNILVPNVDNVRTDFLVHIIAKQSKSVLLIGEQGSAKTVMIQGYCGKYDPEAHMFKSFNFSSASTPLLVQVTRTCCMHLLYAFAFTM